MRTDLYTKIVLTVIAVALVANFFKDNNPIQSAYAQDRVPAPAPIERQVIDVNLVQVNGMDLYKRWVNLTDGRKAGCLPISLEYMDDVEGAFNVNIEKVGGESVPSTSWGGKAINVHTY